MTRRLTPFHLAMPVDDLETAREFYGGLLGCPQGRSSDSWVDFDFFGHQLVCHIGAPTGGGTNPVDGDHVPVPHFGVVMEMEDWQRLADRLGSAGIRFVIEPHIRFKDQPGEQATMFFHDPSGNALEFKAFRDIDAELFRT